MASCGSCDLAASASSIRITFPSTSCRRRYTSSRSLRTGKTYDAAQGQRLPAGVRDLQIDYTALSFVAPEKVRFRVKLEGWDADWKDVGTERKAFYSNLPPRNYRFRVMACNNSGVWNEAGAFLDFSIAPTIYQRTSFRVLVGAVFLALLFAAYRVRVQRVRRQEQKLRGVIETIPVMTWTALPDGSVDFVNRQWLEYTGLTVEQSAGSGWQTTVHPEDLERHLEKRRTSLETGQPFENELRLPARRDGNIAGSWLRAVPLRDDRGKILKWYGTSTDIEERERSRQLESELAHINRVSMLGELTASLAHEINQPIAATITNANACMRWLRRDQPDVEEAYRAAERIRQDGERTGEIVARLRSFYKKDTPGPRELVDVNEIVGEMLVLLRSEANRYSIVMRTELAAELPQGAGRPRAITAGPDESNAQWNRSDVGHRQQRRANDQVAARRRSSARIGERHRSGATR